MHDAKDTIIYVGKAISLKNRVRQYFQSSRNLGIKKEQMVQQIEQLSDLIRGALPLSEPEVWTAACAAACALAEQRQANPPQAAQPSG